ncbi:AEC family transporter [Acinetobacter faecalis]|uniref:AEC family transporter n=1 Tax=Acinetobacter faecalis TaxID=2665161 RepID=A0ABU5GFX5_9GAMM|nr:AEC family transporter [Acinetobacter faecalis]MDY6483871.1 AEC family transporter [Acinetobacter faecalis]MDY6549472.1 AEC family transporter [Acinetobacter faecalis]
MSLLIFVSLFPLIALIAMGYVLKKKIFVEESFWKGAEKVNYYIFFPAMLFLNLAFAEINANAVHQIMLVVGAAFAIALTVLYSIKAFNKTSPELFGVYVQSILRFNTYIGLAVVASLFQQKGMTLFAIILVFCIPMVNVFSVLALTSADQMKPLNVVISLFKNPLIMGCIVGGLFNVSGLTLWIGFEGFLKQLALCSLPLGLMCVGAALQFKGLSRDLFPITLNTLARMFIMPSLAFTLCYMFNIPKLETQIIVLFFALPTASSAYILTKVLGGDSRLMASIISIQTVVAALSLPIILYFIF